MWSPLYWIPLSVMMLTTMWVQEESSPHCNRQISTTRISQLLVTVSSCNIMIDTSYCDYSIIIIRITIDITIDHITICIIRVILIIDVLFPFRVERASGTFPTWQFAACNGAVGSEKFCYEEPKVWWPSGGVLQSLYIATKEITEL